MKRILGIALVVLFLFCFVGCAAQPAVEEPSEPVAEEPVAEEPVAEEPAAEEPVAEEPAAEPAEPSIIKEIPATDPSEVPAGKRIAYMVTLLNNGFQQVESSMGKAYAESKYGAEVTVFDGNADNLKMAENCEEIAAGGYDMVSAFVWEGETCEGIIQEMIDSGVVVDTYYVKLGSLTAPYIQISEKDQSYQMGVLAAEKWNEWYPDEQIQFAIVGYTELPVVTSDRTDPFIAGIMDTDPEANYIGIFEASAGTEKAYEVTQDLLQVHPEVNIIYSEANDLTLGVQAALSEAGRGTATDGIVDHEILVSTDAPESEIRDVFDPSSSLMMTMGLCPKTCGEARIDALMAIYSGKIAQDGSDVIQVTDYMISYWSDKDEVTAWYNEQWGTNIQF